MKKIVVESTTFIAECTPTPQQRPRFSKWGAYKSSTQKENERLLKEALLPYKPDKPFTGALELLVVAHMPIPKSATKKVKEAMVKGLLPHINKPDCSNMLKNLEDVCTQIGFWIDDRQIIKTDFTKVYSEYPSWNITINEVEFIE